MQYMVLIYGDESALMGATPEEQAASAQAWVDYTQWLKDEGTHVAGDALYPTSASTTLRFDAEGKSLTTDGPFAETKEQLGGYYLLECKDIDEAIGAASRMPVRYGSVEIRPVMEFDEEGKPRMP
jgi:hypothetical protein